MICMTVFWSVPWMYPLSRCLRDWQVYRGLSLCNSSTVLLMQVIHPSPSLYLTLKDGLGWNYNIDREGDLIQVIRCVLEMGLKWDLLEIVGVVAYIDVHLNSKNNEIDLKEIFLILLNIFLCRQVCFKSSWK